MTIKQELKTILLRHEGKEQAITSRELCLLLGLQDRALRLFIRDLREELVPILSSGEGYYLPANRDEVNQCLASMRSRLIADAITRRYIKKAAALYLTPAEQGVLM